jgi:phospholipid/cholesterol/gamma-HCH transport system ATP-binding protein
MILLENISLEFEGKSVLKDVSIDVAKGKTAVILGPSGAGKSTILKLILGLIKPKSGRVIVDKEEITEYNENKLLGIRRKMGMVFQGSALFDSLTVKENVAYFMCEKEKLNAEKMNKRVAEALEFVNLAGTEDLFPSQLSGGMKKRVAIARALAIKPCILLYDEPTAGLDPINARIIVELIKKVNKAGTTSIVVTHILREAIFLSDDLSLMNDGYIVERGNISKMLQSKNPFVCDFFFEVREELSKIKIAPKASYQNISEN